MSADEPSAPPQKPGRLAGAAPPARGLPAPRPRRETVEAPPRKAAQVDERPPALRPAGADVTIPMGPPTVAPTPRTPPASAPRPSPKPRPPESQAKAKASPHASTVSSPAADAAPDPRAPSLPGSRKRLTAGPPPSSDDLGPSIMGSDDDITADLFAALHSEAAPGPVGGGFGELDEPTPPRAPGRLGWWARQERPPEGVTGVRLVRHLAFEIAVVAVTFLAASVLLFTSFGGESRDLYTKGRELLGFYPATHSDQVVLVTVGPEALYLWNPQDPAPDITPRDMLGELISVLDQAGARVIVLDFVLDAPTDGDARLAAAASKHGHVLAAERSQVTDPARGSRFAIGPARSLQGSVASGLADLGEEALWTASDHHLVRSTHLVQTLDRASLGAPWPASVGEPQAEDEVAPHLTLLAAWTWQQLQQGAPADAETLMAELARTCTGTPMVCAGPEALGLPAGPPLHQLHAINFRGPETGDGLATVPAAELLRLAGTPALYASLGVEQPLTVPEALQAEIQGRVVLIGRVDEAAQDRFATPFSFPLPTRPDMDGVRIQAHLLDTLLSGHHSERAPAWLSWALAGLGLGGLVVTASRLRDDVHTVIWLAAAGALVVGGQALFLATDGLVLDLSAPLSVLLVGIVVVRLRGWAVD